MIDLIIGLAIGFLIGMQVSGWLVFKSIQSDYKKGNVRFTKTGFYEYMWMWRDD